MSAWMEHNRLAVHLDAAHLAPHAGGQHHQVVAQADIARQQGAGDQQHESHH